VLPYILSLFAGSLTAISPCVLPALPLIVGSAAQEHRHAPVFVALGMIVSFTTLGVLLASSQFFLGLNPTVIRYAAAVCLIVFGLMLTIPALQFWLQKMLTPFSNLANNRLDAGRFKGVMGQFVVGTLLGAVWSPCVGPTLGATIGLAAEQSNLGAATLMMFLFGIGSVVPLLLVAYGSKKFFSVLKGKASAFANAAKPLMGIIFAVVGTAILIGVDKKLETSLLNILPDSWLDLISRY